MDIENQENLEKELPAEERPEKKKNGKKVIKIAGIAVGAVVAAYAAVCVAAAVGHNVFSKTDVLGVDVSNKSRQQIEEMWSDTGAETCEQIEIPLLIDGEEAERVTLGELGVSITPEDASGAAWDAGRSGNFITNGWAMMRSWVKETSVVPKLTIDKDKLSAGVKSVCKKLSYKPIDGTYRIDGKKTDGFYVTKPADGRTLDQKALKAALLKELEQGVLEAVTCEYSVDSGKAINLQKVYKKIHTPVNAKYDKSTGGIIEAEPGIVFDVDEAKQLLKKAEPGSEFVVPSKLKEAAISKEKLEQVLFRDALGSYTTHVGGTPQRMNNVRLAAQTINGYVLNSGEDFYYNQAVGQRTEARGFQAAPAYVGGKTVDEIGGGICQVSSTLYYATMLSNLQIIQRSAHGFAPSYITFGCDATVSWGGPEYAFRNNTDYPVKIITNYSGEYLTVTIYGTKVDNSHVEIVSKTLSSTDYKVIRQKTDELPAGVEEVEQTPYTGYYVKTWRNVYAGDGTLISSTFEAASNYAVRDEIIKVGTKTQKAASADKQKSAGDAKTSKTAN